MGYKMKKIMVLLVVVWCLFVGCVEHIDNPFLDKIDSDTLNSHLIKQRYICYNTFETVKSENCIDCDEDVVCNNVETTIKEYAHYNHLCFIIDKGYKDMFHLDCDVNILVIPFNDDVL